MSKKEIHRAQILLEKEQYEQLAEIAAEQDRSVSAVIRELVGTYITTREGEQKKRRALAALEDLTALRLELEQRHGVYEENLIERIRAERDADMERVWRGEE